ncbi:MAG: type II secretion system F family protein [Alphaproteobacteria bacterium]
MDLFRSFSMERILPAWLPVEEFYVGLGCATLLIVGLASYSNFGPRGRTNARIKAIQERQAELRGELVAARRRRHKPDQSVNFMRMVAKRLELVKKLQLGKAEAILIQAGFRSKDAMYIMAFFVLILPIILGVAGLIVMELNSDVSPKWKMMNYIWPVTGAYLGLKLPWIFVHRARKKRYLKIQRSLSDVLDLMTICAEAGLSLAASLKRVARELMISYPEMAEELELTSVEMGFLPDRNKALSNLSERCDLPEVRGITSVLVQTEKYGTPIAQALRVLSAEFRQARMLRAEQKAARLPAIMTIPMICFILPTLFIVIISPAIIKLLHTIE